jgi:hypothetical protein
MRTGDLDYQSSGRGGIQKRLSVREAADGLTSDTA